MSGIFGKSRKLDQKMGQTDGNVVKDEIIQKIYSLVIYLINQIDSIFGKFADPLEQGGSTWNFSTFSFCY